MRSVGIALAAGLTIFAAALGVVLSRAPVGVAGTNRVPARFLFNFDPHDEVNCSAGGTVPAGTVAIRVSLSANIGPRVAVRVLSMGALVTQGAREAGWGIAETVTVPVRRVAQTTNGALVCTTIGPTVEDIQVNGAHVRTRAGRRSVALRLEYLRPGPSSWLSLAGSVARNLGVAHAPSGAWVAYLLIVVMLAVCVLASRLALRELR